MRFMTGTHVDIYGHPIMVDVTDKEETLRSAEAEGWIFLPAAVLREVLEGNTPKGDVLKVAEIAGIMATKRTPELIPLCHPIRLDSVQVYCVVCAEKSGIHIVCRVRAKEVTGVEMEALQGVAEAALCIYDMCKGIDKGMTIEGIRLLNKSGGKSGTYVRGEEGE